MQERITIANRLATFRRLFNNDSSIKRRTLKPNEGDANRPWILSKQIQLVARLFMIEFNGNLKQKHRYSGVVIYVYIYRYLFNTYLI